MMGGMEHTQSPRSAAQPVDARRLAALAALLAEPTRAAFCLALLDGRAWTAGELARQAGVARSTATEQLNALVDGGLLAEARQGRHRYLQLADPAAAELVELLAERADPAAPASPAPGTLSGDSRRRALARARTCYDHLAGTLGVAIMDAMTERGLLDWTRGLALTPTGEAWLAELGVPSPAGPARSRRPAVRPCIDWTERRPHLAGSVGAALCRHALDTGWLQRIGTSRAVRLTADGTSALQQHLGLAVP
ncbi:DNA-binding transcriptional ArsR family regulator [Kitasatospora sp. GP30]|nr:DNA-binding transcriptional ArsR family regulator [Kitasatospora sp. GP30]